MEKDIRIDTLKGVLISFVVLGHCLLWGGQKSSLANWIYIFHMPFFVFISGYLTHVNSPNFWKGIIAVAESYIVYQIIKGVLYGYSPMMFITTPASMMWYLFALINWRCFYFFWTFIAQSLTIRSKSISFFLLVLLVGIGLFVGYVSRIGKTFALSRIIVFAPFFWLGTMVQGKDFIAFSKKIPFWSAVLILTVTFAFIVWITPRGLLDVREVVRCVNCFDSENQLLGLAGRAVYYVLAVINCIAIARLLVENKVLSRIGKDSLKFYLFHGVILRIMSLIHMPWNWWLSVVYFFLLMTSIYFFNLTKLSDFAIRPIHFIRRIIY